MKITNNTHYTTSSLKKLFTRCLVVQEKSEGKLPDWQRKKLHVTVKHSKKDYYLSGRAFINGTRVTMFLPKLELCVQSTAFVFLHELLHIRGHYHKTINDKTWREIASTFANEYTIDVKEVKPKEKVNLLDIRYLHVLSMIHEKEKTMRRLQIQLKKWTQKKKYYEKAIAKKG